MAGTTGYQNTLERLLENANDLLRSVHAVATRKGVRTNWDALRIRVEAALLDHYRIQVMPYLEENREKMIPPATATAKTFRIVGEAETFSEEECRLTCNICNDPDLTHGGYWPCAKKKGLEARQGR